MKKDRNNNKQSQQEVVKEEPKKSVLKPMGKKPPRRISGLRKRKRFLAKAKLTLEEYLAKFFRIRHCRQDHLTIVTLKEQLCREEDEKKKK